MGADLAENVAGEVPAIMKEYKADFHIHTCLSPCGEAEMMPSAIVRQAKTAGLDMIGICDHNSTENVAAVLKAARRESLSVIPGIEITSREEVHIAGLFRSVDDLIHIQSLVDENLTGENDETAFGSQTIVNENDQITGNNSKLLIGATDLTLEEVIEAIHTSDGLAIAAHIDRPRFSLQSQLGFIPEGLKLDALEVSPQTRFKEWADYPVLTSSDAHCLRDIGKSYTSILAEAPCFEEIHKALHNVDNRSIFVHMEDLSLHILDIVENSVAASTSRVEIVIDEDSEKDSLTLTIRDNGKGMDEEIQKKVLDPFYTTRTTRKVGLGLPLLAQAAKQSGGNLELQSRPGQGTTVKAVFQLSHPDLKPMGDISETIQTILAGHPELQVKFEYKKNSQRVTGFDSNRLHDEE